ncbi:MAG: DUF4340 domain-containing protein [Bacteroidales bacterium]|nr:DUF4340 domain-containing protein [Bacteroidales bacterium]
MKNKHLIIIILIILSAAASFFWFEPGQGTMKSELRNFAISDTSNVVKIFLADKANRTILLDRQDNSSWLVNGEFRARKDMIDLLLGTMKSLQARAPVPKAAHNTAVANLASRSVKVEIYQKKYRINLFNRIRILPHVKRTKVYYVGDVTPDNIGTFMIMENATTPFVVYWPGFRGFVASRYSVLLEDWRDHTVFENKLPQIQMIEVVFSGKQDQSYKIIKNRDGRFYLIPSTTNQALPVYDTLKMLAFLTAFENIRYEALINDMDMRLVDSIISSQPQHIITVTDTKGNRKQVKTFKRIAQVYSEDEDGIPSEFDTERMYALMNEEKDFVLIQHFVFDKILKPLDYFRKPVTN